MPRLEWDVWVIGTIGLVLCLVGGVWVAQGLAFSGRRRLAAIGQKTPKRMTEAAPKASE